LGLGKRALRDHKLTTPPASRWIANALAMSLVTVIARVAAVPDTFLSDARRISAYFFVPRHRPLAFRTPPHVSKLLKKQWHIRLSPAQCLPPAARPRHSSDQAQIFQTFYSVKIKRRGIERKAPLR
jgi:hypothetical protein